MSYHTFQATTAPLDSSEAEGGKGRHGSRRISTTNACVECRRRKIRCDGASPCGQCQWYQHPQICTYSKPTQRVVPSRRLVEQLQIQVDQSHSIISRLFPGHQLETLVSLSREELVDIAVTAPSTSPLFHPDQTPATGRQNHMHESEGAESLEALEQAPEQDPQMDEAKRHKDKINAISDDVNGLSLSVDKQSSYVGISSISAALKVIFKTTPLAREFILHSYIETAVPSRSNSPPPQAQNSDQTYVPPANIGHKLIESYFNNVHVLMPMIDEDQFWYTYLYGERNDSPWLALLNMVMAFGSLAKSTADSSDHLVFYNRARKHLDLETFGSGNLLVLQALGLFSGYYLHWLNRPNEANCLMGATLRMATALGLHREYNEGHPPRSAGGGVTWYAREVPVEIRRRTVSPTTGTIWWSLFCLDAWGSTTTGRPSLGRMGPGITVQSPQISVQMNNAQYRASLRLLPIIHNIEFCKLATRIQDTLAARSLCKFDELFAMDAELVKWHNDLPPILRDVIEMPQFKQRSSSNQDRNETLSGTPSTGSASRKSPIDFSQPPDRDDIACPDFLKTPRAIMHWRYLNLRMLMHRPFLLATALRRSPYASMSVEEKLAVSRCRIIAGQTIVDINSTCEESLIAGWNAVWLIYQAVMVPLVSLFSHLSSPAGNESDNSPAKFPMCNGSDTSATFEADKDVDKWRQQIEITLLFLDKMRPYSVAAKKSKDVVERLYEASKHVSQYREGQYQTSEYQVQRLVPPREFTSASTGSHTFIDPKISGDGQFIPQEPTQDTTFGQPNWGLSPHGDAAMNSFWDDMMWETFPEMPQTASWIPGLDQFDYNLLQDPQNTMGASGQTWLHWPLNEQ